MARGEHLKNPDLKGWGAVIRVHLFTKEGRKSYTFGSKSFRDLHPTVRERIIKEALEAKLGTLHELSGSGKQGTED